VNTAITRSGPILIAYDGSAAADHAVRESGALLKGQPALVVVIWKQGVGFEFMEIPTATLGLPPAQLDVRTAVDIDDASRERAQLLAQRGADLARQSGFEAEGLAIAEDVEAELSEAILDVARKRDARGIVIGAHSQGGAASIFLGSTSRSVVRHAPCPVLVVREQEA
jgi:nucleotide-binding universal stress UspA family protein